MNSSDGDKVVHPVEKQWHYPIMMKAGFAAQTLFAVGFVRSYHYLHPDGRRIRCTTGVNGDHWEGAGDSGYWSTLEKHVQRY